MRLSYSAKALKELSALPKNVAKRIQDKMDWYVIQKNPLDFAKPLIGMTEKIYRFRIGDFRIICTIESKVMSILFVLAIKHRSQAYD